MRATPPLLALIAGRKPRARRASVPRPKEQVLHIAVAKLLREHALSSWQWTHIASGELRDMRTAVKLKRMGVKAGWPDFVMIPPTGQIHSLELKRIGENLSEAQEQFQTHCIRYGWPHAVARTIDEALAVLDSWGCLRIALPRKGGAP